jgi:hypothetical protein
MIFASATSMIQNCEKYLYYRAPVLGGMPQKLVTHIDGNTAHSSAMARSCSDAIRS